MVSSQGWQCPICKLVWAPYITGCNKCNDCWYVTYNNYPPYIPQRHSPIIYGDPHTKIDITWREERGEDNDEGK